MYTVYVLLEVQSYGSGCVFKGPILWEHDAVQGPTLWVMCKGPTNPMGIHLWGHDAGTEDQSYGSVHVDTRTNVQSQVALYHVRGPGTQYAPAKSSCQMEYFYRDTCNNTQIRVGT